MGNLREYFRHCPAGEPGRAAQTGTQLARSGIENMDMLCRLLEREPETLLSLRNIGPKSMNIIREVCTFYRSERSDVL